MASHLSFKLNMEHYEMCSFVQVRIALAEVQSNTLILRGYHNKETRICLHPEMSDEAVMALLAPWRGRRIGVTGSEIGTLEG